MRHELPEETAEPTPGPGQEAAQADRTARHSADHTSTQRCDLRDGAISRAEEAARMRQVHGALLEEPDAGAIVHCLVGAYGR
jgi:hypothetical protein